MTRLQHLRPDNAQSLCIRSLNGGQVSLIASKTQWQYVKQSELRYNEVNTFFTAPITTSRRLTVNLDEMVDRIEAANRATNDIHDLLLRSTEKMETLNSQMDNLRKGHDMAQDAIHRVAQDLETTVVSTHGVLNKEMMMTQLKLAAITSVSMIMSFWGNLLTSSRISKSSTLQQHPILMMFFVKLSTCPKRHQSY